MTKMKENSQELSFKELFYDEVDFVEQIVSKAQNTQEIVEIRSKIDIKDKEMNSSNEKFISKFWKLALLPVATMIAFVWITTTVKSDISNPEAFLIVGMALSIAAISSIPMFCVDRNWAKERKIDLTELFQLRKQLAETTLGGKIVSNIEEIDEHWQSVYVQKDGEKQEYMIRLQSDDEDRDVIETKKIEVKI